MKSKSALDLAVIPVMVLVNRAQDEGILEKRQFSPLTPDFNLYVLCHPETEL